MGTKQMTLLEKAPTRVPGQSLLQAELLACPPWDHLSLLGWLSQAGSQFPLQGTPALGKAAGGWKCQALLWEMHWEFSKMEQICV